ncbi:hypothetical protein [Streptomyces sp. NBC_01017]
MYRCGWAAKERASRTTCLPGTATGTPGSGS